MASSRHPIPCSSRKRTYLQIDHESSVDKIHAPRSPLTLFYYDVVKYSNGKIPDLPMLRPLEVQKGEIIRVIPCKYGQSCFCQRRQDLNLIAVENLFGQKGHLCKETIQWKTPLLPKCQFCGDMLNSKQQLVSHLKEIHFGPRMKSLILSRGPFTCPFCPFTSKYFNETLSHCVDPFGQHGHSYVASMFLSEFFVPKNKERKNSDEDDQIKKTLKDQLDTNQNLLKLIDELKSKVNQLETKLKSKEEQLNNCQKEKDEALRVCEEKENLHLEKQVKDLCSEKQEMETKYEIACKERDELKSKAESKSNEELDALQKTVHDLINELEVQKKLNDCETCKEPFEDRVQRSEEYVKVTGENVELRAKIEELKVILSQKDDAMYAKDLSNQNLESEVYHENDQKSNVKIWSDEITNLRQKLEKRLNENTSIVIDLAGAKKKLVELQAENDGCNLKISKLEKLLKLRDAEISVYKESP